MGTGKPLVNVFVFTTERKATSLSIQSIVIELAIRSRHCRRQGPFAAILQICVLWLLLPKHRNTRQNPPTL